LLKIILFSIIFFNFIRFLFIALLREKEFQNSIQDCSSFFFEQLVKKVNEKDRYPKENCENCVTINWQTSRNWIYDNLHYRGIHSLQIT